LSVQKLYREVEFKAFNVVANAKYPILTVLAKSFVCLTSA